MFSHPYISDVLRRQHVDRLIDETAPRRRFLGRRHAPSTQVAAAAAPAQLAPIVALPTRVDRTSPRGSRVA